MSLIESPGQAARLAQAILTDIRRYNQKKLSAGADLGREIGEGRALYRRRVDPTHYAVFETAVDEFITQTASATADTREGTPMKHPALIVGIVFLVVLAGAVFAYAERFRP